MSLLRCCTGGKRRSAHKTNAKSPPPIDRQDALLQPAQSFSNLDTQQTQPALSSFRMRVAPNNNHVASPATGQTADPILGPTVRESDNAIDHTSLDQILANLLSDISSPSFQRTTTFQAANSATTKTTENGKSIAPLIPGLPSNANGHYRSRIDHNANSFSGNVFSYEPSSNDVEDDDYDVPCGASDDDGAAAAAAHHEQGDYDFPSTPTSCTVTVSRGSATVVTNEAVAENGFQTYAENGDDYDRPRAFNAGGGIVAPAPSVDGVKTSTTTVTSVGVRQDSELIGTSVTAGESTAPNAASIYETPVVLHRSNGDSSTSLPSSSPTRPSSEERQSLMEQFKTIRLGVLMSMSQVLMSVGAGGADVTAKIANVVQLSSSLKSNLSQFVEFIRLLLDRMSRAAGDDGTIGVMVAHIGTLNSIRNGLDEYVEDIDATVERNETTHAGLKLAGVMHVTKDLPTLLRAFVPLVERVQISAYAEESARQNLSESTRFVADDNPPPPVASRVTGGEVKVDNRVSNNNHPTKNFPSDNNEAIDSNENRLKIAAGAGSLPPRGPSVGEQSDARPPVIPPKHKRPEEKLESAKSSTINHNRSEDAVDASSRSSPRSSSNDRLLSVSQTNLSAAANPHDEPVMRRRPVARGGGGGGSTAAATDDDSGCISQSELETPSVRASGVSQTTVDQLEELRRQADSQLVRVHSDFSQHADDLDTISLSSACMAVTPLSSNDRRLLVFYCGQVNNNWNVLDNAAAAFFRCMERKQSPKVFVTHSKFVILAGHKLTYIGGIVARNIEDEKAQDYIVAYSNSLCSSLKVAVRTTKDAALKFPDVGAQQLMVDSIKDVTDWAIELKEVIDRLTYLGQADSFL